MQEAIEHSTLAVEAEGLAAAARRAEAWAGEPFLRPEENPAEALGEGRARRRALDDGLAEMDEDDEPEEEFAEEEREISSSTKDPGAVRRYRFRHPTASGKTIAAAGFVDAARSLGVLILTHRRLLVSQFQRDLRVPPGAAIHSVPIVGGDFEERALAQALDHQALNQAAASLYRDRFDSTPGIVYAAGVEHAYNLAKEFRAAGLKAEAVSGRTPPVKLAETLAAYERGEINVLINAMLLAEGWNSPRATVCMHLAPTASRRVYQQRIGRIMRLHPRKEAGIVVDFVPKGATHNDRVVSLHSLLDADFYREGARVTPAPRRRSQRRARRRLTPAPWLVPVTPDVRRRIGVIQREWQRVDPRYLDDDEQRYWATIAGRQIRFDERASFVQKLTEGNASKGALEQFLATCAAENPNRRLRMMALSDRVSMPIDSPDFDDLVTLITQAPTWEKDRLAGIRILLRAIAEGKPIAPEQTLARWTWRLARATRKVQDRRASGEYPEAKRLLGALANSRGHRHEENAAKLVNAALEQPLQVGVALLASAEGYTPRATQLLEAAREQLATLPEVAQALAENLPQPKLTSGRSRRRQRRREKKQQTHA